MASRRQGTSEAAYDDRRERDYGSRNGSRYDDRYEDVEIRRSRNPPVQEREVIREPAYLREDYGRTSAGPVVLRAREREDFEFSSRPRRRSPSPERKVERESIVIRRDESERPAPKRERSREREEIIIRRDERSRSRAPPPPPQDREREEIIIKRSEDDRKSRYEVDDTKSRRVYRPPPVETYEREEIIIRREEEERRPAPRDIDFAVIRPKSRERERSRGRRYSDASDDEIVITRENRSGRRGERDEIIIRHHSASRSPSPSPAPSIAPSVRPEPPLVPQIVNAPEIHQEIITHHRHIDHGYEVMVPPRPRPISRPPSPPSPPPPPPPRERSEERIEIRRRGERNGRAYDEDIIIDRNEGARSAPPRDFYESPPPPRRAPVAQQLMVRPPSPEPEPRAELSGRYGRARDPTAGLWTEVTKDLVVKEAIVQMGYEFEESEDYYYIIAYLRYEDVSRLVGLSEDIRKDRRRRMKEMEWENRLLPLEDEPRPRLAIDSRPPPRRESPWEREDERYIEREIIYRGGRPPPPVAWRR